MTNRYRRKNVSLAAIICSADNKKADQRSVAALVTAFTGIIAERPDLTQADVVAACFNLIAKTRGDNLSARASAAIHKLLGPEWIGLPPHEVAGRLSKFSQSEVLRTRGIGRVVFNELDGFLNEYACSFREYYWPTQSEAPA